uniref:Uncharacterized protein n=1 Tax=Rhizophora mucronata TaxID=61149 RepID=A0A2P2NCJ3_RHIMU
MQKDNKDGNRFRKISQK